MTGILKALCPREYHQQFLQQGVRSDGRHFDDYRQAVVQVNAISTSFGSSMIRQGDCLIMASIRAELGRPSARSPDRGRVELRITSSKYESGFIDDGFASPIACCDSLQSMLDDGLIVDLTDLCIEPGKVCWVLICDITLLEGALSLDACVVALSACLQCTKLPTVVLKPTPENFPVLISSVEDENTVIADEQEETDETLFTPDRIKVDPNQKRLIKLNPAKPIVSIFAVVPVDNCGVKTVENGPVILADPSEEELTAFGVDCDTGLLVVAIGEDKKVYNLHIRNVGSALDDENLDRCLSVANDRCKLINRLIREACSGN